MKRYVIATFCLLGAACSSDTNERARDTLCLGCDEQPPSCDPGYVLETNANGQQECVPGSPPPPPPPDPTWERHPDVSYGVLSLWADGNLHVVGGGIQGYLYHIHDGEMHAFNTSKKNLQAVWGNSGNDIWMADDYGGQLHFDGSSWTPQNVAMGVATGLWGSGAQFWALGQYGNVAYYDGTEWDTYNSLPGASTTNAISGSSPSNIWVVGGSGYAARFNGTDWTEYDLGSSDYYGLWVGGPNLAWAVGEHCLTKRWNGSSWVSIENPFQPTFGTLRAVHGTSANNVWFVGNSGRIMRWNGFDFEVHEDVTEENLVSVWTNGSEDVWVGQHDAFGFGGGALWHYAVPPTETEPPSTDCTEDCQSMVYTACTCGVADPCGWQSDGYCDVDGPSTCEAFSPHFDDSADCP